MVEPLEARYGLPQEVVFCRRCIMSNQRPASSVEFQHRVDRKHTSLHIDEEGICDACRFAETKEQLAGFYMLEACDCNEAIRLAQKIPPCALRQRGDSPGKRVDGGG